MLFILTWVVDGQCKINDTAHDSVFINFEREAMVKVEGEQNLQKGVALRLHNNSSCAILITTGSVEQFYRPLPPAPTIMQRLKREIDYEISDGTLVPEVQYTYSTSKGTFQSVGGDNFYGLVLPGYRTMLFEVPLRHLDRRAGGRIDVEFKYLWENRAQSRYGSVTHRVSFGSERFRRQFGGDKPSFPPNLQKSLVDTLGFGPRRSTIPTNPIGSSFRRRRAALKPSVTEQASRTDQELTLI